VFRAEKTPTPILLMAAAGAAGALTLAACSGSTPSNAPASSADASAAAAATPSSSAASALESAAATEGIPAQESSVLTGVPYAEASPSQTLDLYLPAGAGSPAPLVVLIHGGAFAMGDSSMESQKAQALVDEGFAVASINYRLSGEALFPAGAQDAKAAVRFLRANADEYGIDPDRIGAWGSSAGGWLASMLGVTGDQETVFDDPALGNPDVSSGVQAVVSWFGPTDFATMDEQSADVIACAGQAQVHGAADSPESRWLGGALADVPEVTAQTDLGSYVAGAAAVPAFYFAHGDSDCNVPDGQSRELAAVLAKAGIDQTVTIVEGAGHADRLIDEEQLEASIAFLQETLGG
jgi:acetyl esterase/lipase